MAKSEMVHARVDNALKVDAENIFEQLGLKPSDAITLFYKQVALHGGLPFAVKLPEELRAQNKLMALLKEAEDSVAEGGWLTLEESKAKLGL